MATVAAVFAKAPFVRTPQMIIDSLFPAGAKAAGKQPAPSPERKRVWASPQKSKSDVIEDVRQEVLRRDPGGAMTLVALTDGERAFQKRVVDPGAFVGGPSFQAEARFRRLHDERQ